MSVDTCTRKANVPLDMLQANYEGSTALHWSHWRTAAIPMAMKKIHTVSLPQETGTFFLTCIRPRCKYFVIGWSTPGSSVSRVTFQARNSFHFKVGFKCTSKACFDDKCAHGAQHIHVCCTCVYLAVYFQMALPCPGCNQYFDIINLDHQHGTLFYLQNPV